MALDTTLNNHPDGGDNLISRDVIEDEILNLDEAHLCLVNHVFNNTLDSGGDDNSDECYERMSKTLKVYIPPREKYECCCNHEANSSPSSYYSRETDHDTNIVSYPSETYHEEYSSPSSYHPYETSHEANNFVYLNESNPVTYSFLYPYETDDESNSFVSSYYPYETQEVENRMKSTLHSQFQEGDLLSRMSVGSLGLESYGFISTPDCLLNTLSVRSLGLEEYGFIDED